MQTDSKAGSLSTIPSSSQEEEAVPLLFVSDPAQEGTKKGESINCSREPAHQGTTVLRFVKHTTPERRGVGAVSQKDVGKCMRTSWNPKFCLNRMHFLECLHFKKAHATPHRVRPTVQFQQYSSSFFLLLLCK